MADNNPDFIAALQELVGRNSPQDVYIASPASSIQITKTGDVDQGRLLASFQAAYPDLNFETFNDQEGRSGIRSLPKLKGASAIGHVVPDGYSPQLASQGLKDLQAALENSKDDEERFTIATKLNTLVQTQKAFSFTKYKDRAEREFGVPEIETAIEQIRQAELRSPFNPGNGMPSQQRMALIEQLGVARTRAGQRIGEYMQTDTSLIGAENLAKGTIAEIQGRAQLAGRQELLDERRAKKDAREAAISSLNPTFVNSVSVLRNGRNLESGADLSAFAAQIVDGKIRLTDTERAIATASDENLVDFYLTAKAPKDRQTILSVLDAREKAVTLDDKQAKRNMDLFKAITALDLSDTKNPMVTPQMREKWKRLQSEVTANAAATGKSKDEMLATGANALRRELMAQAVKASFYSDVRNWEGVIKSDDLAKGIMRQTQIEGQKIVSFKDFVDRYLDTEDGRNLQEKSKSLQAALVSSVTALPPSAVLPIPSQESLMLEAQQLIASRVMRRVINPGVAAPFPFNVRPIIGEITKRIKE